MSILWGLSAAIGWGMADFWATRVSRAAGPLRALMWNQGAGLVLLILILASTGEWKKLASGSWPDLAVIALLQFTSAISLYRAFKIGTLSIVSPIAASYLVVTALLVFFTGGKAPALTLAGAALLLCGVTALTAFPLENTGTTKKGITLSLGSAVGYGVVFWSLPRITSGFGPIVPLIALRASSTFFSLVLAQLRGETNFKPSRDLWKPIVIAGTVDVWAWASFTIGTLDKSNTTVVTALSSLFGGVTVMLAWIFLKERLSPYQWAGVGIVLLGIVVVSL